jgi:neurofibromin 1
LYFSIVAKPYKRDKFEVTPQNVAYLSALVSVSEEVSDGITVHSK